MFSLQCIYVVQLYIPFMFKWPPCGMPTVITDVHDDLEAY